MNYQHERCDGCGQPFAADDDIVVCPVCATPQHRACYEKEGRCVNEDRHESGYVWQGRQTESPAASADAATAACPVCGFRNRKDARLCIQCGTPLAPAALLQAQPQASGRDLFFDVPDSDNLELDEDERAQLEAVLNQRAALAAPGMTAQQEDERIAGHPIKQVLTFVGSNALRYLRKFRRTEEGSRVGWNWAAFFLSPYWFFYRKLFRPGIIFLTLRLALAVFLMPYETKAIGLYQSLVANSANLDEAAAQAAMGEIFSAMLPVYIGGGVLLVLAIVSALLADRLYYNYVKRSMDAAKAQTGRDAFLLQFFKRSGVSVVLGVASYAVVSLLPSLVLSIFN